MPFYAITSRQVPVRWCFFKFPSFPPKKKTPPKRNHGFLLGISTFFWDHAIGVFNMNG